MLDTDNTVATTTEGDGHRVPAGMRPAVVDCDVHPVLTTPRALLPYLDEYWGDQLVGALAPNYETNFHPRNSPIAQRAGLRTDSDGRAGTRVEDLVGDVFADGHADLAILNCLYGIQQMHQPRREAAHARALNDWIANEWLERDERLRASIVVPQGTPELAAEEIRHRAGDKRFVQVLLLGQSELLYGRQSNWPIWEAAAEADLPVAIHIGGVFRQAPTSVGWPTSYTEWYVGQTSNLEAQLNSIVSEGIFQRFPGTQIVVSEVGFKWLAPFMWKFDKLWKSYRGDVPWLDRAPSKIIRDHVKFTTAPSDGAEQPGALDRTIERMGSDEMLVYSSDYPHQHASRPLDIDAGSQNSDLLDKIHRQNAWNLYRLAVPSDN